MPAEVPTKAEFTRSYLNKHPDATNEQVTEAWQEDYDGEIGPSTYYGARRAMNIEEAVAEPAHAKVHPDTPAAMNGSPLRADSPEAESLMDRVNKDNPVTRLMEAPVATAPPPAELMSIEALFDEIIFKIRLESGKRTAGIPSTILDRVRDLRREWMRATFEADRWEP